MTDIQVNWYISDEKVKNNNCRRKEMVAFYSESLSNIDWLILPKLKNFSHAW